MAFHGFIAGTPRADQQAQGMEMLSDAKMKAVRWLEVYQRLNDIVWCFLGFWFIYILFLLDDMAIWHCFIWFVKSCWNRWNSWCGINMISDVEVIEFEIGILQVAIRFGQGVVRCVSRTDTSAGVRWGSGGRSFDGVPALSFAASASQETWATVGSHGKLRSNLTSSQFPSQQKTTKTNKQQATKR